MPVLSRTIIFSNYSRAVIHEITTCNVDELAISLLGKQTTHSQQRAKQYVTVGSRFQGPYYWQYKTHTLIIVQAVQLQI